MKCEMATCILWKINNINEKQFTVNVPPRSDSNPRPFSFHENAIDHSAKVKLFLTGGPSIDIEKQLYAPEEVEPLSACSSPSPNPCAVPSTSINITAASPSNSILKANSSSVSLRRGSGNNNSNYSASFSGIPSR